MTKSELIYVAGHSGLAGSAICRALNRRGHRRVVTATHKVLDLTHEHAVDRFFDDARPAVVVLAAAKVGGIIANSTQPADFIRINLQIQTNTIDACRRYGVRKLLFLGSSCIYPRLAPQPMRESDLMTGPLEPTNEPYAMAKLAGIKMCEAYRRQYGLDAISVVPTNLYGPNDNFSAGDSHALPGLMRRMHNAKVAGDAQFAVWGTGKPQREFLHADDFAEAACMLLDQYGEAEPVNIGCGQDVSIAELAAMVRDTVGYAGELTFDTSKPDGMPRKLLDITKLRGFGWTPAIALADGLKSTYRWYLSQCAK